MYSVSFLSWVRPPCDSATFQINRHNAAISSGGMGGGGIPRTPAQWNSNTVRSKSLVTGPYLLQQRQVIAPHQLTINSTDPSRVRSFPTGDPTDTRGSSECSTEEVPTCCNQREQSTTDEGEEGRTTTHTSCTSIGSSDEHCILRNLLDSS